MTLNRLLVLEGMWSTNKINVSLKKIWLMNIFLSHLDKLHINLKYVLDKAQDPCEQHHLPCYFVNINVYQAWKVCIGNGIYLNI